MDIRSAELGKTYHLKLGSDSKPSGEHEQEFNLCVCPAWIFFREYPMRMPLLSYFFVVGMALLGLLFWSNTRLQSDGSPIKTSQLAGLPKIEFPDEPSQPLMTTVNFAAEHKGSGSEPASSVPTQDKKDAHRKKNAHLELKRKQANRRSRSQFAEYPSSNNLGIPLMGWWPTQ
jgi:hypothetical protein